MNIAPPQWGTQGNPMPRGNTTIAIITCVNMMFIYTQELAVMIIMRVVPLIRICLHPI